MSSVRRSISFKLQFMRRDLVAAKRAPHLIGVSETEGQRFSRLGAVAEKSAQRGLLGNADRHTEGNLAGHLA
jgi:hypothetical protein